MEYGYYITDTAGNRRFFVEGCSYCRMGTGGQHEPSCPLYPHKIVDEVILDEKLKAIRERSHKELGEAWQYLANH